MQKILFRALWFIYLQCHWVVAFHPSPLLLIFKWRFYSIKKGFLTVSNYPEVVTGTLLSLLLHVYSTSHGIHITFGFVKSLSLNHISKKCPTPREVYKISLLLISGRSCSPWSSRKPWGKNTATQKRALLTLYTVFTCPVRVLALFYHQERKNCQF